LIPIRRESDRLSNSRQPRRAISLRPGRVVRTEVTRLQRFGDVTTAAVASGPRGTPLG
jgi:hypothetical protein